MTLITGYSDLSLVPESKRQEYVLELIEKTQLNDNMPSIDGKIELAFIRPVTEVIDESFYMVSVNLNENQISNNIKKVAKVSVD